MRAHCKTLSREDRSKLINEAMAADDDDTLASILGSPHFLSGLSAADQAHYTHQYHSKKNPDLVARLELMTRVRDMSYRTGPAFHRAFEKAVGGKPSDVSAIAKANARAEAALKIEPSA